MANVEVEIVANNFDEIRKAIDDATQKALNEIGIKIQEYASNACVRDTGRLAGSITYATATNHSDVSSPALGEDGVSSAPDDKTVVIGTRVYYATYIEEGTSKRDATPFLKPAVNAHKSEIKSIIQDNLQNL